MFLNKLKTILHYNYLYYFLLGSTLLLTVFRLLIPIESQYTGKEKIVIGTIIESHRIKDQWTMTIQGKEKLRVTYYLQKEKQKERDQEYNLGEKVKIYGELEKPIKSTTKNTFDYQEYLKKQHIFYLVKATKIVKVEECNNFYFFIKQAIRNHLQKDPYLNSFLLGDNSYISKEAIKSYQINGLSHLFAISGMQMGFLSQIFLKILKRVPQKIKYSSIFLLLFGYSLLIGCSASVIRGVLFFIFFSLNHLCNLEIRKRNLWMLVLSIALLINPYFILNIGAWYSFSISFGLLMMSEELKKIKGYFKKLWKTSFLSLIISLPISLSQFYEVNLLSILYNLFYIPLINIIIFPFSIITSFISFLNPLYQILTSFLESSSLFLSKIKFATIIFPKLPWPIYAIYIIAIIMYCYSIKKEKNRGKILLILVLLGHYFLPILNQESYLKIIDVDQGDSLLLHSNNCSILVDTGGKEYSMNASIIPNITIPLLKSQGIRKLDYLILTHGDQDHMGEASYLLENFPVEKIILNLGKYSKLEQELVDKDYFLEQGYEGYQISCGQFQLLQLNETFENENDSSQIYYITYQNISMLLMGDASIKSEQKLLEKYEIPPIYLLKIGHHGSKTSTSLDLLKKVKPQLGIISVGKENRYGHPHIEVLNRLEKNKVLPYLTSSSGTITINFSKKEILEDAK